MKHCSKICRNRVGIAFIFFILFSVANFGAVTGIVEASEKDDFNVLVKHFREKNYPVVKNLARDLIDNKDYRYHIKIILSEVYFQENDLYYAEDILKELLEEYPVYASEINKRLDKVGREKAFLAKGSREQERRFLIYWTDEKAGDKDILPVISDYFNDAHQDAGRFFRWYPDNVVKVLLYRGGDYGRFTVMPPWSGGGYDGKIRIMIQKNTGTQSLKEIVFHEYAHVAIHGITKGNCPLWFNEAVAQYFSIKYVYNKNVAVTTPPAMPNNLPGKLDGYSDTEIKKFYHDSLSLLAYMIKKTDESIIQNILDNLGKEKNFKAAVDDALSVYGMNSESLFK
jgi:hypothetical protein